MPSNRIAIIFVVLFTFVACDSATENGSSANVAKNSVANKEKAQQEEDDEQKSAGKSLLDIANKLLDEKAKSGSEGAKKVQELMSEKFGELSDGNSEIAEDAAKWASDAFKSLKGKGLTSADSAKDWITEDIRNMNALKYKVVKISLANLEAVEDELNRLGKLRWDCFHAVEQDGQTILFFKKERRSIIKNIPVKDMLKLVPLMNDGGEN